MFRGMSSKADKAPSPDGEEDAAPAKGGKTKKLILLAIPVLLLAVGGGLWFTGVLPKILGLKHGSKTEDVASAPVPIFVDLPDLIANLNSPSIRPSYIKLHVRLEVANAADAARVKEVTPRLQDMFQTYLREMRPDELRSSRGSYRLREELLGRANVAVAPARVNDILFTQMIIQ
jgi:flagellar protein FliL